VIRPEAKHPCIRHVDHISLCGSNVVYFLFSFWLLWVYLLLLVLFEFRVMYHFGFRVQIFELLDQISIYAPKWGPEWQLRAKLALCPGMGEWNPSTRCQTLSMANWSIDQLAVKRERIHWVERGVSSWGFHWTAVFYLVFGLVWFVFVYIVICLDMYICIDVDR
jgi:hypothetical protein